MNLPLGAAIFTRLFPLLSKSILPVQGWLGIGRTTFIIVILLLGAVIFIRDTERLVLRPLERMVQLVRFG